MQCKLVLILALIGLAIAAHPWEPAPRPETWWTQRHAGLLELTKKHAAEEKVVFLGDSITEGWAGNGKQIWEQHYANRGAFNYGIGGDRTEHILWRIQNGEFDNVSFII